MFRDGMGMEYLSVTINVLDVRVEILLLHERSRWNGNVLAMLATVF